jgi:RNA polymerase sigma-70 factor (ECF subfamily)
LSLAEFGRHWLVAGVDFPETQWTLLAEATLSGDADGRKALKALCERYEKPVLALVTARVKNAELARDLAQGFWLYLLERRSWRIADATRGRFRSFLISVLRNYLNDDLRRKSAQRRSSDTAPSAIDVLEIANAVDAHEAAAYDREWALCILSRSIAELESWYKKQHRDVSFATLRLFLPGSQNIPNPEAAAAELGVSVAVLRVEIHRARSRLLSYLKQEIGRTVPADEIANEMAYLGKAIALADQ